MREREKEEMVAYWVNVDVKNGGFLAIAILGSCQNTSCSNFNVAKWKKSFKRGSNKYAEVYRYLLHIGFFVTLALRP